MFTAIFSTIMESFAMIFWKKSLRFGVGTKLHDLLGYPIGGVLVLYFLCVGIDFGQIDLTIFFGTFLIIILHTIISQLNQKIYKEEKLSLLLPYKNISKIIVIIIGYFIFSDVSFTSLVITLIAIVVMILFSIDYKTLKLPRNMALVVLSESLLACCVILTGWLLFGYSEMLHFILYFVTGLVLLLTITFLTGQLQTVGSIPKQFYFNRELGGMGWVSWFLSLMVIKNLGLSITILLSFIGIGITLLLSFIILNDKPSKKDLMLTFIITSLIGLGFYFK
ncbi:hypothetical protein A9Q91_03300 [Candidatus Gracilibacteria bacterium 28_42_T64]|nr:hypothetical protein A9Q91_03300 [Candidatus Gracilibacteria bacterium 28_42_T64]